MTDPTPKPTGQTLEQLLHEVLFADPDTHPIKADWEETVRQEEAAFERVCQERYEHQLEYHRICLTPNPEEVARWETDLCKPMWKEELDARLAEGWEIVLRKVRAVLEAKRES
jgi:hypothetical protein